MKKILENTAYAWKNSSQPLVFSGAGMSAESGVPTFRGSGGLWSKFDVEKAAYIDSFLEDPAPFWEMARELMLKKEARPHAGHHSLARLEQKGYLEGIITQNIDGLHQKAGNRKVFELHGSLDRLDCLDCGQEFTWAKIAPEVDRGEVGCNCGSERIKPRIVFFGEALPREIIDAALDHARQCDFLVVIGSSLEVFPAATIPQLAWQQGAKMVLINSEPTFNDAMFDWIFREEAGKVLPRLEELILGETGRKT